MFFLPCLKKIWADAAHWGEELADWCRQQGGTRALEIVEHEPGCPASSCNHVGARLNVRLLGSRGTGGWPGTIYAAPIT
jgi:hypothetical protein